jgi:hypothetical protein
MKPYFAAQKMVNRRKPLTIIRFTERCPDIEKLLARETET